VNASCYFKNFSAEMVCFVTTFVLGNVGVLFLRLLFSNSSVHVRFLFLPCVICDPDTRNKMLPEAYFAIISHCMRALCSSLTLNSSEQTIERECY